MVTSRRQAGIRNSLNPNKETRKIRPERTPPKLPEIVIGHRALPKRHKPEDGTHPLEVLSENLEVMNHPGLGKAIPAAELVLHIVAPEKVNSMYESYRERYHSNATFKQRRNKFYEMKNKLAKEFKLQMIADSHMQNLAVEEQSAMDIFLGNDEDGNPDILRYHEDPGPQHSLGSIGLEFSTLYSPMLNDRSIMCLNPVGFSAVSRHNVMDRIDDETRDVLSGSLDRVNQAFHEIGLIGNPKTDSLRFSDMSLEMPVFEKTSANAEINTPLVPMGRLALQPLSVHISS